MLHVDVHLARGLTPAAADVPLAEPDAAPLGVHDERRHRVARAHASHAALGGVIAAADEGSLELGPELELMSTLLIKECVLHTVK